MNYLVAVDHCFLDAPGGMARVAWDIAREVKARGHRVAMLCGKDTPDPPNESQHEGIRIIRYTRPSLPSWHPLRAQKTIEAGAAAARDYLGSETWDTLHIHSPFTGTACLDAFPTCGHRVLTVHSPLIMEQRINWRSQGLSGWFKLALGQAPLKKLERAVMTRCDVIHALSCFTRTMLDQFYNMGHRVTVIPHWRRAELRRTHTKVEARRLLGWPEDRPILFTVRHHGPRNGIDIGIKAVAPFAAAGKCYFMVGGDGRLRTRYQELARSLGAAEGIHFLGRMPEQNLNLAYQAADLFLLPTRELECFGLIMLEAFAFGCPVLSSDAGAIPETMQPVLPGFIVPAGDPHALEEKVGAFLKGRLVPPPPQALVEYTNRYFDSSVIVPKLLDLLIMEQGSMGVQHASY